MQSDINDLRSDMNDFAAVNALHGQRITALEETARR